MTAQPGVEIITSPNVKDELQLSGNSLENVSQSAADIQQICRVRNKDIRKVRMRYELEGNSRFVQNEWLTTRLPPVP